MNFDDNEPQRISQDFSCNRGEMVDNAGVTKTFPFEFRRTA